MNASGVKRLLEELGKLSKRQRAQLLEVLRPAVGIDRVADVIDQAAQCA